jgi:hypothetical protein
MQNLELLYCWDNQITSLMVSENLLLTSLSCGGNNINSLDVSSNTNLTHLNCAANQLSSIDVTQNSLLVSLLVNHNANITELNVSSNPQLWELFCDLTNISSLDVTNNLELVKLHCSWTQISEIDLSQNTLLGQFHCDNNFISHLDLSNNPELYRIYCNGNNLNYLNINNSNNTILNPLLAVDNPNLTCIQVDDIEYANNNEDWHIDSWTEYREECILDVPGLETINHIQLFPNPTENKLNIINNYNLDIYRVQIYDYQGRIVLKENSDFNTLELAHLNSGIFFLRIESDKGIFFEKIIRK